MAGIVIPNTDLYEVIFARAGFIHRELEKVCTGGAKGQQRRPKPQARPQANAVGQTEVIEELKVRHPPLL
jgi:hypothetical protein